MRRMMREGQKEEKLKNYFFAVNSERRSRLREANVVFCDLETDRIKGVVLDQDNIDRALLVLGARWTGDLLLSPFDGIIHLSLQYGGEVTDRQPQYRVEVSSWDGKNQDGFLKALEEILLPAVGTDVILDVPHGKFVTPASDGKFHIYVWSSPAGYKGDFSAPKKIWGIGVDCQDSGFKPSGQGVPIVDAESGWAVAELVGSNLYVHHDVCHEGRQNEIAIFRRLLEEVVIELTATPEEKAERAREAKRAQSREAYMKECSKRFNKTVEGTKRAIAGGEARIGQLQQELSKKIREVAGIKRKMEQLEACSEIEKYGREFDKLLAVPKVIDVQVADGVVKVFTDTLYCVDPRTKLTHEIGKFRIEIYENCSNGGVRWFNLTRKVRGYDERGEYMAPHINGRGEACFGNTAEIWPELIGNYEFATAAMVAIQFVESVNTDDSWGKNIIRWPVAVEPAKEG